MNRSTGSRLRLPAPRPAGGRLAGSLFLAALAGLVGLWYMTLPLPLMADDIISLVQTCRLVSIEYGTLYHLGYCAVVRASGDYLAAYAIKQAGCVLALGLLAYQLGRAYGGHAGIAAGVALWVTLAHTKVNGTAYAALLVLLLGCLLARRFPRFREILLLLAYMAAFLIRTEYLVGLAILTIITAIKSMRSTLALRRGGRLAPGAQLRRRLQQRYWQRATAAGVVACLLCAGAFLGSRQYSARAPGYVPREWLAFGQHYALNYAEAYQVSGEPTMEWERIVRLSFPASTTPLGALAENPAAVLWHIGYSLRHFFAAAVAGLVVPAAAPGWPHTAIAAALLIFVLGSALQATPAQRRRLAPLLIPAAIPLFGMLPVRSTTEYLLPWLPLLIVLFVRTLSRWHAAHPRLIAILFGGCLSILAAGYVAGQAGVAQDPRPPTQALIQLIRAGSSAQEPAHVFGSWYANRVCGLVGSTQCAPVNFLDPDQPGRPQAPRSLLRDTPPGWIVVGPDWQLLSAIQGDPELRDWRSYFERNGCHIEATTRDSFEFYECRKEQ